MSCPHAFLFRISLIFRAFNDPACGFFTSTRAGLFHHNMNEIVNYIKHVSSGWILEYQLKGIDDVHHAVKQATIHLPREEIPFALYDSICNGRPGNLTINSSLSDDLLEISVMHSVCSIGDIFDLRAEGAATDPTIEILDFDCLQSLEENWDRDLPLGGHALTYDRLTWHKTYFSSNGSYLLAYTSAQTLALFRKDSNQQTRNDGFCRIAETAFDQEAIPLFHPTKHLLCLTGDRGTWAWSFYVKGEERYSFARGDRFDAP